MNSFYIKNIHSLPNSGFIELNEDICSMACELFVAIAKAGSFGNKNAGFEINKTPLTVNNVAIR